MWDLGSGVSAILGAVVGGGVTYAGTVANLRWQSRQAKHRRKHALLDRRHDAHLAMIEATIQFADRAGEVQGTLTDEALGDEQRAAYQQAWDQFSSARAAALLSGPRVVTESLREMQRDAIAIGTVLDKWIEDHTVRPMDIDALENAFAFSRVAYIDTARQHLSLNE